MKRTYVHMYIRFSATAEASKLVLGLDADKAPDPFSKSVENIVAVAQMVFSFQIVNLIDKGFRGQ